MLRFTARRLKSTDLTPSPVGFRPVPLKRPAGHIQIVEEVPFSLSLETKNKEADEAAVAVRTVPSDLVKQAPNSVDTWSQDQQPRIEAIKGNPRFLQVDLTEQPRPLSAMALVAQQPIVKSEKRIASCDGGGDFGHPKVYINLDANEAVACMYCGTRFHYEEHHH